MKYHHVLSLTRRLPSVVILMTFFLVLIGTTPAFSQVPGKPFSISFKDKSVADILDFLATKGDYKINYSDDVKNDSLLLTISFDDVDELSAVESLLSHTHFMHNVDGNVINVFKMQDAKQGQFVLKGSVKDKDGLGVPFATVQIKGTSKGVIADIDGNFSMPLDQQEANITISSVGFEPKTLKGHAGKDLNVVLVSSAHSLGEVTVIAYGKRNTREQVGAITSVKPEDLQKAPTASIENLLQGRMAGVDVSNLSGSPGGGGSRITIRGFSSLNQKGINDGTPLYVIDGIPVWGSASEATGGINPLAGLDPSSIESVQVLKDAASASLYGSRAGNGVILITTKKGKSGKSEVSVNVSQSLSWLPSTPMQTMGKGERDIALLLAKSQREAHYDYLTDKIVFPGSYKDSYGWDADNDGAYDYLWRNGRVLDPDRRLPAIAQDSLNTFYNNRTNWWKYAFRVGRVTKADLQLAGGTNNIRYMVNAGIYDERGIMISSNFRRYSLLSNLDFNLSTKLSAFTRINLTYATQKAGSDGGRVQGLTFDPKQTSTLLPGKGSTAEQIALRQLKDIDKTNSNYNVRLSIGLNYNIFKGLRFSSTYSLDHYFTRVYTFTPDYLKYDLKSAVDASNIAMTNIQAENILTYNVPLSSDHKLELMAGMTYNYDLLQNLSGTAKGGPTNSIKYAGEGWPSLLNDDGTIRAAQSFLTNQQEQSLVGFLGRAAYNYKKRYMAEVSVRSDGSSVFGKDVRWGTFPSVGLGWAFSEEHFMKKFWWLSFGKLRASWGKSGQKFQEPYLALGVMEESNVFNGSLGLIPQSMANKKLTWEESDQYDVGLDLQFLDYRLKLKLDYYYKYSSKLLMQSYLPGNVFLATSMWDNASAISNEGIEFEAQYDIIRKKNWNWSVGMNLSHNKNMLRKTYNGEDLNDKVLGRPVYGIYTFKDEGIVQKEEDIPMYPNASGKLTPLYFQSVNNPLRVGGRKIKDQNFDGVIDDKDLYYAGSTLPAVYGGLNSHLEWKGLSLDVLFSYTIGRKVMNMYKNSAFTFTKDFGVIMNYFHEGDFWTLENRNAKYPSLEFADKDYIGQFDGNVDSNIENISFLRLKQLVIGYQFPKTWLKGTFVKDANIYLSGENLFLITNYSGVDPEVINPYTGKDDGTQYPLSRKVTLGLNLKF
ncbi:TonB-dependent receptor plug [Hallella multisaccharivorax DSM 17128]|uniref:TonB-dependent receptor plug n=1 Tax=Hallella multisaccharivorax DSM 17128 TaxID=688246 RepID=F8N7U4_9BACT|nr:SusC/RagA family TonB-linked outer membrane protein [Hallella multisaccharivorax]EGN56449.1 TonB-dependent receptor plug [Hallella multisaccharivorax DSM 17128]